MKTEISLSFSDYISRWSKEPQWENDYGYFSYSFLPLQEIMYNLDMKYDIY